MNIEIQIVSYQRSDETRYTWIARNPETDETFPESPYFEDKTWSTRNAAVDAGFAFAQSVFHK